MSDKANALGLIEEEYHNLEKALDGLTNEQMERPFLDGWCARDIIAHILGWSRESAAMLQRLARGERPAPEGVDYSDTDGWNAKFAAAWRAANPNTVVATWRQAHANFVRAAQAVPDDRYAAKADGAPSTASRIVEGNGYGHYREHIAHIRKWRQHEAI